MFAGARVEEGTDAALGWVCGLERWVQRAF